MGYGGCRTTCRKQATFSDITDLRQTAAALKDIIDRLSADVTVNYFVSGGALCSQPEYRNRRVLYRRELQPRVDRTKWHRVVTFQPGLVDMLTINETKVRTSDYSITSCGTHSRRTPITV